MKSILSLFRRPSLTELAERELQEAEHAKLAADTAREYAEATIAYNNARIKRLRAYIAAERKNRD
jgi:hypothetical protein